MEQVFSRELAGGARAVVLFNRAETVRNMSVAWPQIGLKSGASYDVRDVWARNEHGAEAGAIAEGYSALVQPHAVVMIRVSLPGLVEL